MECKDCKAILNSFSKIEESEKGKGKWRCEFCETTNTLWTEEKKQTC